MPLSPPLAHIRDTAFSLWQRTDTRRAQLAEITSWRAVRRLLRLGAAVISIGGPFLLLWWYYCHIWRTQYWERGGDEVRDGAFPAYRVTFVILCWCVPVWAAFMAGITIVWPVARLALPLALSKLRTGRRKFSETSYYRLETMDVEEALLSDDDTTVDPMDDPASTKETYRSPISSTPSLWPRPSWWLRLSCYIGLASFGLYAYATFENTEDFKYRPQINEAVLHPRRSGYGKGEKVFIAAMFHRNEDVLPFWIEQMNRVIHWIGTDNVYVSVLESYSNDTSAELLDDWNRQLGIMGVSQRRILTRDTTVIRPKYMTTDIHRMEFLVATRNRVLEPLETLAGYDRLLFSNDIFVHAESVVELLNTRDGDYDVACGMDFGPWGVYDNWVTRDSYGQFISALWPYLVERSGGEAIENDEPAPVSTCWNGIFAARAAPFMSPATRKKATGASKFTLSKESWYHVPWTHPAYNDLAAVAPPDMPALKFRVSGEAECFSSESFLLPYDLRYLYGLWGHYMNPRVVNTYVYDHYLVWKYVYRHWLVQWWIKNIERGYNMHKSIVVVGHRETVYSWEGGQCHGMPWR